MSDAHEIFHHCYAQSEEWLTAYGGRLVYHRENDGAAYLTKGPEAHNEWLTAEEAIAKFPAYAEQIRAALNLVQ